MLLWLIFIFLYVFLSWKALLGFITGYIIGLPLTMMITGNRQSNPLMNIYYQAKYLCKTLLFMEVII